MCRLSGPWQEQDYLETVSVRSMPTSHKIPPPSLLKNIPSGTPMAASLSDSPPLTPSGQETVVQPTNQRA
ncbi:hypothetical protein CgunFtcFv8_009646 [Champsocephalus gunnari]|uniref:Uncharacterized protein n=1 Tax=Champsocephalus gunnari TaxID=52237 RepID=A0AAN8C382_CHAGU|nr:hypothetical protein CgunFtcFv8_009646 [Champsocephalus gunnari]